MIALLFLLLFSPSIQSAIPPMAKTSIKNELLQKLSRPLTPPSVIELNKLF